jgi:hypothetical protein
MAVPSNVAFSQYSARMRILIPSQMQTPMIMGGAQHSRSKSSKLIGARVVIAHRSGVEGNTDKKI